MAEEDDFLHIPVDQSSTDLIIGEPNLVVIERERSLYDAFEDIANQAVCRVMDSCYTPAESTRQSFAVSSKPE